MRNSEGERSSQHSAFPGCRPFPHPSYAFPDIEGLPHSVLPFYFSPDGHRSLVHYQETSISGKASCEPEADRSRFEKRRRHFEIDLSRSGLAYDVGDSLGVFQKTIPCSWRSCWAGWDSAGKNRVMDPNGQSVAIREALGSRFRSSLPRQETSGRHSGECALPPVSPRCSNPKDTPIWQPIFTGTDIDADPLALSIPRPVLYPGSCELAAQLQPRLYSIASSPKIIPIFRPSI